MIPATKTRRTQPQMTASKGAVAQPEAAIAKPVIEEIKAMYDAKLRAAFDKAKASERPEVATPEGFWDLITIGVFQNYPYSPGDVIKAGQPAGVLTIVLLNPFSPSPIDACSLLSNFALPFEVTYQTGDITNWKKGPASVNTEHNLTLVPGQCWYLDYLDFTIDDTDEVLYEMNVSARIFGCNENYSPFFAGFSREVYDVDTDFFLEPFSLGLTPGPLRFMVAGGPPTPPV